MTPESIRTSNIKYLNEHGFYPAEWLPLPTLGRAGDEGFPGGILRPASEIATRLLCHAAVFAWGSAPPAFTDKIVRFMERNDLNASFTPTECEIIGMDKAEASDKHSYSVGWRLENMWSLAWGLGITPEPSAVSGQIADDISGILMGLFLPDFETLVGELVDPSKVAEAEDVVRIHDLFYLAHNAVRAGQLGNAKQIPDGFDPIRDGGAVHERRHSLSWMLSPGVPWDDTDLST